MRPRANTISHVDNMMIGRLAAANPSMTGLEGFSPQLSHHPGMNELSGVQGYRFRGMSTAVGQHGHHPALPRLETSGLGIDISGGLRTAPPYGGSRGSMDMEPLWLGPESTVNPAQLHFSNSPQSRCFETPASPFDPNFGAMPVAQATLDDEGNFTWLDGFENPISFQNPNEQAIEGSSPSIISTGSHSGLSEPILDYSQNQMHALSMWSDAVTSQTSITPNLPMDWSMSACQDSFASGQFSPKSLQTHISGPEQYLPSTLPTNLPIPLPMIPGAFNPYCHPPMIIVPEPQTPSNCADSISSSNRQSSMTSISADSITDANRQALLAIPPLQPNQDPTHLTIAQPSMSSFLSPASSGLTSSVGKVRLPSTYDLQRYVAAYIQYFHPHLPFLHTPSLSFDHLTYASDPRRCNDQFSTAQSVLSGSVSPLILAMAAIGALYDYDIIISKTLFEMAKKEMDVFIEENPMAYESEGANGSRSTTESSNLASSLWLIQVMVLIVIYGYQCGEKISAEIASSQCASLVDLVRRSQLASLRFDNLTVKLEPAPQMNQYSARGKTQMGDDETGWRDWTEKGGHDSFDCQYEWHTWKLDEERKRTLYVVFILSSLLISGHIHMPTLTNAEIRLSLPCDENRWGASSADSWRAGGGKRVDDLVETPFTSALSFLLTANERQQEQSQYNPARLNEGTNAIKKVEDVPERHLQPSTFGCLILIHALYSYIWETRQRHMGRVWTTQETQQMHDRVEPALKAWQAIWGNNPHHSRDRANSRGGPLATDCIPLLDMAYLGLYVNLSSAKKAFWQRDYHAVADELARGPALVPVTSRHVSPATYVEKSAELSDGVILSLAGNQVAHAHQPSSNRERHLRQAAYCAANSLVMSMKIGVTFLNCDSRDLPIQAAMSVYDSAQILAEWVATVQERIGRYVGIVGIDYVDFCQVPSMLLDEEDCRLLEKTKGLVDDLERNLSLYGFTDDGSPNLVGNILSRMEGTGFGSKLLAITGLMLKIAPVWPGRSSISFFFEW